MHSTRHEQVYHATQGRQAASLSLTALSLRGLKRACQVESQKNAGFLARFATTSLDQSLLGCCMCMLPLSLLKGSRLIAAAMGPQGKDDPDPDIGKRAHGNRMAFAFSSFALVVVSGPRLTLGRLPGKLKKSIAQGFDATQASMGLRIHPALIEHWRGSPQSLQAASIPVARAIIPDFSQESRSQMVACTWQALEDPVIRVGQKKGIHLLVVLSNLLDQWQQLRHQGQCQTRFASGDDGISLQMGLVQPLKNGRCHGTRVLSTSSICSRETAMACCGVG